MLLMVSAVFNTTYALDCNPNVRIFNISKTDGLATLHPFYFRRKYIMRNKIKAFRENNVFKKELDNGIYIFYTHIRSHNLD